MDNRERWPLAIQLEFINLIVPVQRIRDIYPGGWDGCLAANAGRLGKIVWYDENLFHGGGAMDPEMIDVLIERWTNLGFAATEVVDGKAIWKDFAILDSWGISQYDCPWIVVDGTERIAWLRGTEPGEVIGRDHFRRIL